MLIAGKGHETYQEIAGERLPFSDAAGGARGAAREAVKPMLDLDTAAREIGAGRRGPDVSFDGVTTDSRQVAHGDLFVALRGERFDGHEFVDQALAAGAAPPWCRAGAGEAPATLADLVDDTRSGLGRLAAALARALPDPAGDGHRQQRQDHGEGDAGRDSARAAGDDAVLATSGNLNNDIGVPLMLLRLRSQHRYAVIEMGMNHLGEIGYLTRLALPSVAAGDQCRHRAHR